MSLFDCSGYELQAPTSPRSLVAIGRLGLKPEDLVYRPKTQGTGRALSGYLQKQRQRLAAARQMAEFVAKYGVTEEEGEAYNLPELVSANAIQNEVAELCEGFRTEMDEQNDDVVSNDDTAPLNTPIRRPSTAHGDATGQRLRGNKLNTLSKSALAGPPLTFEECIARKRASISSAKADMIARAEAILHEHAKTVQEEAERQRQRSDRRYHAMQQLMKQREEARHALLAKQNADKERREQAHNALVEQDLNRMTLMQYNLHVKELKRIRFLEFREIERAEQKQQAVLDHFYSSVVRHRREELWEQKREAALQALEAKQKIFHILDEQTIIGACERGLHTRTELKENEFMLGGRRYSVAPGPPRIEGDYSLDSMHAGSLGSKLTYTGKHSNLAKDKVGIVKGTCKDLNYVKTTGVRNIL